MTWNADSISTKKHEFLNTLSHPDFKCYRLDREGTRTKGAELPYWKILECIGIYVSSLTGSIHFISTYRPGSRTTEDIRKFTSNIQLLTSSRPDQPPAKNSHWLLGFWLHNKTVAEIEGHLYTEAKS
jgi:hypothetical protein